MTPEEKKAKNKAAAFLRWENRRAKGNTKQDPEHTRKIADAHRGKKRTPEQVERYREAARKAWQIKKNKQK